MSEGMTAISEKDFSEKYTNANLSKDSTPYDGNLFGSFLDELNKVGPGTAQVAPGILAAMLCAQRRGDAVPQLFQDLAQKKSDKETKEIFLIIREGITIIFPFVGLPNCIPACLGLVGELQKRDITVERRLNRSLIEEVNWSKTGTQMREKIYRGVGNPEVHLMIANYFPDLEYITDTAVFGFLLGGSLESQALTQSEIILASAITAMGATRQARSHCKAAIGVGNSIEAVQTVVNIAVKVAEWNNVTLPGAINVPILAQEIKENLEKQT